jgi:hypothetical protein
MRVRDEMAEKWKQGEYQRKGGKLREQSDWEARKGRERGTLRRFTICTYFSTIRRFNTPGAIAVDRKLELA